MYVAHGQGITHCCAIGARHSVERLQPSDREVDDFPEQTQRHGDNDWHELPQHKGAIIRLAEDEGVIADIGLGWVAFCLDGLDLGRRIAVARQDDGEESDVADM